MFPFEKYHYYKTGNKIIAVSTYAGKTVKGYAKCDPRDEFDTDFGKRLAAARCGQKIAAKKIKHIDERLEKVFAKLMSTENEYFELLTKLEEVKDEKRILEAIINEMSK